MTGLYLFGALIAAGLLVYLVAALLFPEDFL
ncbi:K(+)-transporting ATPase subunit F [Pseudomonas sp.]